MNNKLGGFHDDQKFAPLLTEVTGEYAHVA